MRGVLPIDLRSLQSVFVHTKLIGDSVQTNSISSELPTSVFRSFHSLAAFKHLPYRPLVASVDRLTVSTDLHNRTSQWNCISPPLPNCFSPAYNAGAISHDRPIVAILVEHCQNLFNSTPTELQIAASSKVFHNKLAVTHSLEHFGNPVGQRSWKEKLDQLHQHGVEADCTTYVSLLRCCGDAKALADGRLLHQKIIKSGLEGNIVLASILVQMYGKCGSLREARDLFGKMPERDHFMWNHMITVHARLGEGKKALPLFFQLQQEAMIPDKFIFASMLSACASLADLVESKQLHARISGGEIESDVVVGTALISMYGKSGNLEAARRMFDKMYWKNMFSWNAMIAAYTQQGLLENAIQLFEQMQQEGAMANNVTFISILSACANQAAVAEGKRMHTHIVGSSSKSDIVVDTALISMYGRCGFLEEARYLFDQMHERDPLSWNTMIAAYVQSGQGEDALRLFDEMQHQIVMPSKVTFISVLSACASQGALAEEFLIGMCFHGIP